MKEEVLDKFFFNQLIGCVTSPLHTIRNCFDSGLLEIQDDLNAKIIVTFLILKDLE